MKRQHRAVFRRMTAIAMLCTLLFSNSAVYADTADDGGQPSEEVEVENSGIAGAGEIPEANLITDSGENIPVNTNIHDNATVDDNQKNVAKASNDEAEENSEDKEDELSLDSDELEADLEDKDAETKAKSMLKESKVKAESEKDCEHINVSKHDLKYVDLGNGCHEVKGLCKDCGEYVSLYSEDCNPEPYYVPSIENNMSHEIHYKCRDCGAEVNSGDAAVETEECDFDEIIEQLPAEDNTRQHKVIKTCKKCHRTTSELVDCTTTKEIIGHNAKDSLEVGTGIHTIKYHCSVCDRTTYEDQNCAFPEEYVYEGRYDKNHKLDLNIFNDKHYVFSTCPDCGKKAVKEVACQFSQHPFIPGVLKCDICGNLIDNRSTEIEIKSIDVTDINGNPVESDTTITANNKEHKVFDKQIKIRATVYSEVFNVKNASDWKKSMKLNIYYSDPEAKVAEMELVTDSVADGSAVYEWTVPEATTHAISVAGFKAEYKIKESYLLSWLNPFDIKNFKSQDLGYIIRTSTPSMYMDDYKYMITGGDDWVQGDTDETKWYSKTLHKDDLTVQIECTTGNRLSKKSVSLLEVGEKKSPEIFCDSLVNPKTNEEETETIEPGAWKSDFADDIYVSYNSKYTFTVPATVEDEHKYKLNNTSIEETIDTFIDNTIHAPKADYGHKFNNKKINYINKDVPLSVFIDEKHLNYKKSYITIESLRGKGLVNQTFDSNNKFQADLTADDKYKVTAYVVDLAGNSYELNDEPEFVIDKTAPVLNITFDNKRFEHGKYYKENRVATFEISDDEVFENLTIDDVSLKDNVVVKAKGGKFTIHDMEGSHCKFKGEIVFDKDGKYQITDVKFKDKAGNVAIINQNGGDPDYGKEFIIDKTKPVISVKFDNNSFKNDIYYKDPRVASITIDDANFSKDQVTLTKNSGDLESIPALDTYDDNNTVHKTKIHFERDGRYGFEIYCTDLAGNVSDKVVVNDFVIDRTAPELEILGVSDMSANNGSVKPVIKSKDLNINDVSTEITLTGSNHGTIHPEINKIPGTGLFTYELPDIAHEKNNDDLYTLTAKLTDFAGNVTEKKVTYSINRFGSVYVLSDATKAMVDGRYVTHPQDVVITEINVDSLKMKEVSVANDGNVKTLKEGSSYVTNDVTNSKGWHSISYKVDKSNFDRDGIYSVAVFSEDKASNKQSNQAKDAEIEFVLDATAPSVIVSGIEEDGIYEEESHDFSVNATDTIGVKDMKVYLNNEKLGSFTAEELSENGGTEVLTIPEKDDYQNITIECSDVAGNTTKLAYNNLLVSVKAEELLIEDEITPTSKLGGDIKAASNVVKNTKALPIVIAIIAIAGGCVAGVFAFKKKKH